MAIEQGLRSGKGDHRQVSIQAACELFIWRWGWGYPLSMLLCIGSFALWFTVIAPGEHERLRSEARLAAAIEKQAHAKPAEPPPIEDPVQALAGFPRELVKSEQLARIVELAEKHEIKLGMADYRESTEGALALKQVGLALPIKTDYPALQKFIRDLLREIPNSTLDEISLHRDRIDQAQVDIDLKIALWYRIPPESQFQTTTRSGQ